MTDRGQRVKLEFFVWDTTGGQWTFRGYGRTDGSEATYAEHERLILARVPELVGLPYEAWNYDYSIVR